MDNYSGMTNEQLDYLIHKLSRNSREMYALSEEGRKEIDRRLQEIDELIREAEGLAQ